MKLLQGRLSAWGFATRGTEARDTRSVTAANVNARRTARLHAVLIRDPGCIMGDTTWQHIGASGCNAADGLPEACALHGFANMVAPAGWRFHFPPTALYNGPSWTI